MSSFNCFKQPIFSKSEDGFVFTNYFCFLDTCYSRPDTHKKMAKTPTLKKRTGGLGRGLSSLLSDADSVNHNEEEKSEKSVSSVAEILLSYIETNPFQPRTEFEEDALSELADSIKEHGIIQPITVRKLSDKEYQLISGERRLRASKIAGLRTIPAYVRTASDQQMLEMALIENIQREDLNPMEVARSYHRLMTECKLRQEDLGDRVGKKRSTVTNYMRLLKLPPEIVKGLEQKKLSMGHARTLVNIEDTALQLNLYNKIVNEGLSVRKVEELVKELALKKNKEEVKEAPKTQTTSEIAIRDVQQKLSSQFGTQIKINSDDKGKGKIEIPFFSEDDLNRLLDLMGY
jgi:ParB family chromosome partitioning protein